MKKIVLLAFSILVVFFGSVYSQSEMLEKGFSLKFSFGFPSPEYGYDGDLPIIDDGLNITYGLEIGNQWYFYTNENFGIGLDINWFDIVYGKSSLDIPVIGDVERYTFDASLLEFGPVATFVINDMFALEGYYNLRPTYLATYYWQNEDDNLLIYNFGFLHGLGIGARIKFIFIGYEYTFGNIDGELQGWGEYEDVNEFYGKQPMSANNSKLIVGFQF